MNPILALASGIVAAFSPCTVVLIPLMLYSFHADEKKSYRRLAVFSTGFIFTYLLFALLFQNIITSQFQNGIKLGLGMIFMIIGILSFFDKINPLNLPVIRNPFALGSVFSLMASSSPCSLPFLGVVFASSYQVVNLMMFGFGLILPSILFAFFGKIILSFAAANAKMFKSISKLMNLVLIISGFYLSFSISGFQKFDLWVASFLLVFIYGIILRSFFVFQTKADFKAYRNIVLILAMGLIILAAILHCKSYLTAEIAQCSILGCEACRRCVTIFSIAAVLGLIASFFNRRK